MFFWGGGLKSKCGRYFLARAALREEALITDVTFSCRMLTLLQKDGVNLLKCQFMQRSQGHMIRRKRDSGEGLVRVTLRLHNVVKISSVFAVVGKSPKVNSRSN